MQPILFYFDFSSPYAYIASLRVDAIAAKHGRSVEWRPIVLGAVFKVSGNAPLTSQPLKGNYANRDFARSARYFKAPFVLPDPFPIGTLAAARAFYWIQDRDPAQARALAQHLFARFFGQGKDIGAPEVVIEEAVALGVDATALKAALGDQVVKDRLKAEVDKAIELGVCGVPFILIDGEPFWGSDRLEQVDAWLQTGGW